MDPVTMIGLIAVAGMFSTGVALVWLGLRRRPDRLPSGAHAVLAAVMEGALARPDHAIDLVHPPPSPPRKAQPTPAVRVISKHDAPADDEAPEPVAVAAGAPAQTAHLDQALFGGIDDPSNEGATEFFAEKPELQRF
jgi:hypothetical protein